MNESLSGFSNMNWSQSKDEISEADAETKREYSHKKHVSAISFVSYSSSSPQDFNDELTSIIESEEYFLHVLVYKKFLAYIQQLIESAPQNLTQILNSRDHLGTTPALLALKLCHEYFDYQEILNLLSESNCDITIPENNGWSALNEAEFQNNPDIQKLVNNLYFKQAKIHIASFKAQLADIPNFFLELRWEKTKIFSCFKTYEIYKIFKSGDKIRIDILSSRNKKPTFSVFITKKIQLADHSQRKLYFIDRYKPSYMREKIRTLNCLYAQDEVISSYECKKYHLNYKSSEEKVERRNVRNYEFDREYNMFANCAATPKPVFDTVLHKDIEIEDASDFKGKTSHMSLWFGKSPKFTRNTIGFILECLNEIYPSAFPLTKVLDKAIYSQVLEDTFPIKVAIGKSILTLINYNERIENQPITMPKYITLPLSNIRA